MHHSNLHPILDLDTHSPDFKPSARHTRRIPIALWPVRAHAESADLKIERHPNFNPRLILTQVLTLIMRAIPDALNSEVSWDPVDRQYLTTARGWSWREDPLRSQAYLTKVSGP